MSGRTPGRCYVKKLKLPLSHLPLVDIRRRSHRFLTRNSSPPCYAAGWGIFAESVKRGDRRSFLSLGLKPQAI